MYVTCEELNNLAEFDLCLILDFFILAHGICREGLVVNSTGRLKKLENYFKQNSSIQLTGTYDFYTCKNEKAAYKNRNSSDPVFLYWSTLDRWQVTIS